MLTQTLKHCCDTHSRQETKHKLDHSFLNFSQLCTTLQEFLLHLCTNYMIYLTIKLKLTHTFNSLIEI